MFFRSNILALVGGGTQPRYPENKVMLWDDHQMKCIGELNFKSRVFGVRLRKDRVVVILEQKVFIYVFNNLKLIEAIETCYNPRGLGAINQVGEETVLITPEKNVGEVRITSYDAELKANTKVINAHQNQLAALVLNYEGNILATASEKGTLIRLWNTLTGDMIQELRRGSDKAEINHISIDKES